jgi:glycosyltransferase involved in cell wall biosynthesis
MEISQPPLVSIIIPCFNHGRFLPETLESALGQTWRSCEVVVVDDGSTDETPALSQSYPSVRWVRQQNMGLGAARNRGCAESSGSMLVFLDADDRLRPRAVETGISELRKHPGALMTAGRCEVISEDGRFLHIVQPPCSTEDAYRTLLESNTIWTPGAAMFHRSAIESIGGFETEFSPSADYQLYLKLARDGRVTFHNEIVVDYRQHGGQMSRNAGRMLATTLAVHSLERQYAAKRPEWRQAYKRGRRHWRHFYGEHLVEETRRLLANGTRTNGALARNLRMLVRYYPGGLLRHAGRKLRNGVGSRLVNWPPFLTRM